MQQSKRRKQSKYHQGLFKPINPKKYLGDPTKIVYRSGWELQFMQYIDRHPEIIQWQSEELCIPYVSPVDNRVHRYFPDFLIKKRLPNLMIETIIIEIKPDKQTRPPLNNKSKRYIEEAVTFAINDSKWKACNEFCKANGFKFVVLTEKQLGTFTDNGRSR